MRIKKLEIFGFKSFADRVVINFDTGVTGIVGPNGCGKSNVVDALRWVMGEQNAKHLRGDNMQDIIFNGSQTRGALGMAEVVLTLENDGNLVPPEYAHFSEIEVARRLYKTGDSEYEINKRACRLRDITELFLGTGVGTKAYSIIEQGRVANIVSAKPEDRRQIIEEAAGITKYKARRNAAERKMESTQQNLMRISDVKREVQNRLSSLERQAKKAERYHELNREAREIEMHHASLRFLEISNRLDHLRLKEELQKETVASASSQIAEYEEVIEGGRQSLMDDEKKLSLSQGLLYEAENAIALCKQDISFVNNSLDSKQKQTLQINEETRRLEERSKQLGTERESYLAETKQIDGEMVEAEARLQVASAELQAISQNRADKARLVQDAQSQFMQAAGAAAKAQADIQLLNRQRENAIFRERILAQEKESLKGQLTEQLERCAVLKGEIDQGRASKNSLEQEVADKSEQLQTLSDDIEATEEERHRLGEELAGKQSRLKSLEEIEQSYDWGAEGLSKVMRDKSSDSIMGVVADFIEAPEQYEQLIEDVLRQRLEAVIVHNVDDAVKLSKALSDNQEGRVRFYVEATGKASTNAPDFDLGKGFLLSSQLNVLGKSDATIERILGNIIVVKTPFDAVTIWDKAQARGYSIVCESGELFGPDGSIVGGAKAKSAGVLGRKREIRELTSEIGKMASLREDLEMRHKQSVEQKSSLTKRIEEMRTNVQNLAVSLVRFEETLASREAECKRLRDKDTELANETTTIADMLQSSKDELDALQAAWAQALETHRLLEEGAVSHREMLASLDAEVQIKSEEVTTLRIRTASAKERRINLTRSAEQSLQYMDDVRQQMSNLARQLVQIAEDQVQLQTQLEIAERKIAESTGERNILVKQLEEQKAHYEAKLADLRQRESTLTTQRRELEQHKNKLNELLLELQESKLSLIALSDRLHERHRVRPQDIVHDYHLLPMPDFDVDKKLAEIRRAIDQLGGINPNAVKEFEELNQRFVFLKTQSDDLATALEQLESAIAKINATTQQRFEEAFNAINASFSQVFPRLFRGGKAWLELTSPNDLLTTGVEIYAQPPGKKLASIALMSGGEKALTATSLIFAIFLIKPSPFCLLDEVDAPLDEANVDRFSLMVKEMSKISQFIVITHNKRTMEVVDQLYGVTMEQPGISKTVHVRVTQGDGVEQSDKSASVPEQTPELV